MSIVNRRRVYGKRMIPIEYLEADNPYTGNLAYVNCINTGYIPKSNNVRINTKIMWKDYANTWNTDWFGGYIFVDNKMHGIGIGSVNGNKTSLKITYNNYNQSSIYSVEQGGIYEIYFNFYECTINGQIISVIPATTDGSENTAPIYLFRSSMTGSSDFASGFQGRFYYFQIYEREQLVMDLRPVRIGTTGYMYDKVSGKLFRNEATKGKFTLGPDISDIPDIPDPDPDIYHDKVEYIQDGLIFQLDGKNKGNDPQYWTDLKSGLRFELNDHVINNVDNIEFKGTGSLKVPSTLQFPEDECTIEVVCLSTGSNMGVVFMPSQDKNIAFGGFSNSLTCFVGSSNFKNYRYFKTNILTSYSCTSIRGYQNGSSLNQSSVDTWRGIDNTNIFIGGRSTDTYPFVGKIYSIRIYNRHLTEDEVLYNLIVDKNRFKF